MRAGRCLTCVRGLCEHVDIHIHIHQLQTTILCISRIMPCETEINANNQTKKNKRKSAIILYSNTVKIMLKTFACRLVKWYTIYTYTIFTFVGWDDHRSSSFVGLYIISPWSKIATASQKIIYEISLEGMHLHFPRTKFVSSSFLVKSLLSWFTTSQPILKHQICHLFG